MAQVGFKVYLKHFFLILKYWIAWGKIRHFTKFYGGVAGYTCYEDSHLYLCS